MGNYYSTEEIKYKELEKIERLEKLENERILNRLINVIGNNVDHAYRTLDEMKGVNANTKDKNGENILFYMIRGDCNNVKVFQLLIRSGAAVNDQNKDGATPLHTAAGHRKTNFVECLIENGADVNIVGNEYARTPLYRAHDSLEITELLLKNGAVVDDYALFCAIMSGRMNVFKSLLTKVATPLTIRNDSGESCIQMICRYCHDNLYNEGICNALINLGENINNVNREGVSTIKYAIRYEMNGIVKLLISRGANLYTQGGTTPLEDAILCKNVRAIKIFFDSGKVSANEDIIGKELMDAVNEKSINKIKNIFYPKTNVRKE